MSRNRNQKQDEKVVYVPYFSGPISQTEATMRHRQRQKHEAEERRARDEQAKAVAAELKAEKEKQAAEDLKEREKAKREQLRAAWVEAGRPAELFDAAYKQLLASEQAEELAKLRARQNARAQARKRRFKIF